MKRLWVLQRENCLAIISTACSISELPTLPNEVLFRGRSMEHYLYNGTLVGNILIRTCPPYFRLEESHLLLSVSLCCHKTELGYNSWFFVTGQLTLL